jgi:site-specific DNA recombinase
MQVGIYARVSSDQQAETGTINSQIAALLERVQSDGVQVAEELQFIDDGVSGATLIRPALERLRDVVYGGTLERIYIMSPDRLSRKYAYQILLIDEFRRAGVEVVFLNKQTGDSPEDELLLQVQGVVSEYERAKIMERSRRGKLHAAKHGSVSVMAAAPYGYRFVSKKVSEDGEAHYEIVFEEARVVQQIFEWVAKERLTLREVGRRLSANGIKSRTGKPTWAAKSILQILRNTTYSGKAAFGKTKQGPKRVCLRTPKGKDQQKRDPYSIYSVPEDEWIYIPVPPLVSLALFEAVQEQLAVNKTTWRVRKEGAKYLLQGLVGCKICGYAFNAKPCICGKNKSLRYTYYRCSGSDGYRQHDGKAICDNKPIRGDLAEAAVWEQVVKVLQQPDLIENEYKRRLGSGQAHDASHLQKEQAKLRSAIARMIDGYVDGILEKREFEPRVKQARAKLARIESQLRTAGEAVHADQQLRLLILQLGDFSSHVLANLQTLDFDTKRNVIRALVKRVDIDHDNVNVIFRIGGMQMPKTAAG